MRLSFALLALAVSFTAFSCGSSDKKTYKFEVNGCSTEQHSFDSDQTYCEGLRSDSLNHGCAEELRKEAYQRDCNLVWQPTG